MNLNQLHYTIDFSALGQRHSKTLFEVGENLNACVAGAKHLDAKGLIKVVNLGANDILHMKPDLVLGLGPFFRKETIHFSFSVAISTCAFDAGREPGCTSRTDPIVKTR